MKKTSGNMTAVTIIFLLAAVIGSIWFFYPRTADVEFGPSAKRMEGDRIDSVVYIDADGNESILPSRVDDAGFPAFYMPLKMNDMSGQTVVLKGNSTRIHVVLRIGKNVERAYSLAKLGKRVVKSREGKIKVLTYQDTFFLKMQDQLRAYTYLMWVSGGIFLLVLLIAWLLIRHFLRRKDKKAEPVTATVILHILISIFAGISGVCFAAYKLMMSHFAEVSFDQLMFTIRSNLTGTNWGQFIGENEDLKLVLVLGITAFAVCFVLSIAAARMIVRRKGEKSGTPLFLIRGTVLLLSVSLLAATVYKFIGAYSVVNYISNQLENSTFYDEYYVPPETVNITFPEKKKNLIYIYLESMEITHSSTDAGGAEPEDRIPELTELAFQGDCFEGDSGALNGGIALKNTTWTIAGMVAQTAGVSLKIPGSSNKNRSENLLMGAWTIGDVLNAEGYHNTLMIGSDADFGDRGNYFEGHGNYEICDYNWAARESLIPDGYHVWWGFEDAKLYELAKMKTLELAESEEPFNLTILTADTHFTDGYVCEDCPDTYPDQYANVVACSSAKTADFVNWVMEQDFGEDTVIVLSGDHLYMDSEYFSDIDSGYTRKTYVTILNSAKEEPEEKRSYSTMDLYPTTLSAMGCTIEGGRLGLGTDLYDGRKTLLEEVGKDEINSELAINSRYYRANILY